MKKIRLDVTDTSYDVVIAHQEEAAVFQEYAALFEQYDQIACLVDETVYALYEETLLQTIQQQLPQVVMIRVPKGEACKTAAVYVEVQGQLLTHGFTRQSLLLAVGGGAVGDLTGFIAATYMRGIDFIQLPTTILAHDSAVGGKTAINMPQGKNMIGAFHQPRLVYFNLALFDTLPIREVRSGMAELIKHAFISNEEWTKELMERRDFLAMPPDEFANQLLRGIQVKAAIVEEDTFEQGSRKFLNFGHTFGHAVEAHTAFGQYSHGECVVMGMGYALMMSEMNSGLEPGWAKRFVQFATQQGYSFAPVLETSFSIFYDYMKKDKKATFGALQFVSLTQIGQPVVMKVTKEQCTEVFHAFQQLIKEVNGID